MKEDFMGVKNPTTGVWGAEPDHRPSAAGTLGSPFPALWHVLVENEGDCAELMDVFRDLGYTWKVEDGSRLLVFKP